MFFMNNKFAEVELSLPSVARCYRTRLTQHIRFGLTPSPFGILLPLVATSYMLEPLGEMFNMAGYNESA